jgi:tetratricopeptide (TPR) repeat protein
MTDVQIDYDAWRRNIRQDVEANYHFCMGNAMLVQADAAAAARSFAAALEIMPFHGGARHNLALARASEGKPNIATEIDAAIDDEAASEGWLGLAETYVVQGKIGDGVAAFERAVSLNDRNAGAYCGLGEALLGLGRHEAASAAFSKGVALDSQYVDGACFARLFLQKGGAMLSEQRFDEVIAMYRLALPIKPDLPETHQSLAEATELAGLYTAAVMHFQRQAALSPQRAQTYYNIARNEQRGERFDIAILASSRALRLKPDDGDAFAYLGSALRVTGRHVEAYEAFLRARSLGCTIQWLKPEIFLTHFATRGISCEEKNERAAALAWYKKCVAFSPKLAEFYNAVIRNSPINDPVAVAAARHAERLA